MIDSPATGPVVTRIAPSPTGYMHIGTARTALFNWLYARGRGGKFLLRIEDTDKARSTPEATQAILDGMTWLGLDWDGEAVSQAGRAERHAEVAHEMLRADTAYKCFATQDEIAAHREANPNSRFASPWRDADPATHPDAPFVIRIRAPQSGETLIADEVQGDVTFPNGQLDDMILLRSDGTPTYMLAVVVDDHDMGITHVIRGDDHLTNAARQALIYAAMNWPLPINAHIPLIHGPDGKKLSKRHGALGVEEYRNMGFTPAGLRNYLARLGWSHGDDEVFTTAQALDWFDLNGIGKAPARLDFKKMESICGQQIAMTDDSELLENLDAYLAGKSSPALSAMQRSALEKSLYCLKDRAKTLADLMAKAKFVLEKRPLDHDERAAKVLDAETRSRLIQLTPHLQTVKWTADALEQAISDFAQAREVKLGQIAGPLRAALSGSAASPSVFDMMLVLGRDETLARIADLTTEQGS